MIDNDILGIIEINSDYQESERVDRIYNNPEIKPISPENSKYKPKLKVISLDIEVSKETGGLLCIGLYSENYKKNFIISDKKFPNSVSCKNEPDLLEKFKEEIIKQDPDIITGYFSDGFDLPYIKARAEKYKIKMDLGLDDTISYQRKKNIIR